MDQVTQERRTYMDLQVVGLPQGLAEVMLEAVAVHKVLLVLEEEVQDTQELLVVVAMVAQVMVAE